MKKIVLIGKFDDATKEIGNVLSERGQVVPCSEEEEIIRGVLQSENPDLIVVSHTGSAVAAQEKFSFLMKFGIPILGIGSPSDEAQLFICGFLSEDNTRFLSRPVSPEDILERIQELGITETQDSFSAAGSAEDTFILMVDDSPSFLRAMEAMLKKKYQVSFATSGAQAIAAIGKRKPDLILLDYEMPVCDGRMTLEMIRGEEDMKDIPVIFLTGISDAKHVSSVVSLRPQGYLLKPCTEEKLFLTIETALQRRK